MMFPAILRKARYFCLRLIFASSMLLGIFIFQKSIVYDIKDWAKIDQYAKVDGYDDKAHIRDSQVDVVVRESHPLENTCKYAILSPEEETIARFVKHPRSTECEHVMPELVTFGADQILRIDQKVALEELNLTVKCQYRGFGGALRPHITVLNNYTQFVKFDDVSNKVLYDQFEVRCYDATKSFTDRNHVYQFAFAQIARNKSKTFAMNTEDLLSVDMIVLDSTSLNMMRRHMNSTLEYFLKVMGALHLEGYNKVADNSMVNLLPVLAGKRYGDQTPEWPSEYRLDTQLDLESVPFIWKDFEAKGCATMFNDDPMHYTRGLFHYPWEMTKGFVRNPTDHYFRPWHVYHRRFPVLNATNFCFGNKPYYELQLNLVEQMINAYSDTCHFSFSFFTDLPHDNPANLERMDDLLKGFLHRLRTSNALNHTAVIIMGDHGHRISAIMYTYIGRIEERTPFFSVYFPDWFRRKHPDIIEMLRFNKNRFVSNYDVHQMLKDIINAKFDTKPDKREKGISLFQEIPNVRSCFDALVPEHHCACLTPDPLVKKVDDNFKAAAKMIILNYTVAALAPFEADCKVVDNVELINVEVLTTSQMIQHGVRNLEPLFLDKLKKKYIIGEIEYLEVKYRLKPTNVIALIRLQHQKKAKKLFVNVSPLVVSGVTGCSASSKMSSGNSWPNFCSCTNPKT